MTLMNAMAMADATQSTTSLMTSTSHTLTLDPLSRLALKLGASVEPNPTDKAMEDLINALDSSNRYTFIQPSTEICDAALESTKKVLDAVAGGVCDEQAVRLKERKRKRGDGSITEGLRIRKIYTEGFGVEQVWEQARRVIDALRLEAVRELDELRELEEDAQVKGSEVAEAHQTTNGSLRSDKFDEQGFEVGSENETSEDVEEEDQDDEGTEVRDDKEDIEEIMDDEDDKAEAEAEAEEAEVDMDDLSGSSDEEEGYKDQAEKSEVYVEDSHGLNDGFFSIDEFNKQTKFLEQQDFTANPYTGEASDEEEIDWEADPMLMNPRPLKSFIAAAAREVKDTDEDEDDDEDDEDGPTFGNSNLHGLDDTDEEDDVGVDGAVDQLGKNTNDILYRDFFEPPSRKLAKGERQAKFLDRQAQKPKSQAPNDEMEMERAIADVRRDLFDDNSEHDDSEDAPSEADPSEPKARKSAHERRQAKLAEEIRRLEAGAVAKREWTLSGEARAVDRPLNSLLEEDLDFERTGKPVPVITAEVSESIEELIKRRILAQEFDEVIRRRPDSEGMRASARRGVIELDDSKGQQSLAEIYEEEHIKATNPDTYMSKADDKLKKQHQEIEVLWKEVSAKLDALSSWHYKPKPPAPNLTIVADVATIAMEDVQPSTASGVAGSSSMLAPQEIYHAGQDKNAIQKGEVVPKSGVPVAKQEMTREEKVRRRRREKSRIMKRGGVDVKQLPENRRTKEKKQMLDDLKRGGVKVIGKKGDVRDVEGNKLKASTVAKNASSFKL